MTHSNTSTTPDGNEENVPLWRKHFPIDTAKDTARSRREFVGGLAVAGGAMFCGQAALDSVSPSPGAATESVSIYQKYPPQKLAKRLSDLKDGEALLFHFPDHKSPCLLIHFAPDDIVAFSQKCTHLACPVIPDFDAERLQCPCHKGAFDLHSGQPTAGPPRKPLPRIQIEISDDGTLTAIGVENVV